jgi:hypothetical protein
VRFVGTSHEPLLEDDDATPIARRLESMESNTLVMGDILRKGVIVKIIVFHVFLLQRGGYIVTEEKIAGQRPTPRAAIQALKLTAKPISD